jgi:hypothetical protein
MKFVKKPEKLSVPIYFKSFFSYHLFLYQKLLILIIYMSIAEEYSMISRPKLYEGVVIDLVSRNLVTTHDLIIKIFGKYDSEKADNQRRDINKTLTSLLQKGIVEREPIDNRTFGYKPKGMQLPGSGSLETDECKICNKTKYVRDLNTEGICEMCLELSNQTISAANPSKTIAKDYQGKIERVFGNMETPKEDKIVVSNYTKNTNQPITKGTIDVFSILKDKEVRIISKNGQKFHGVLNDVTPDGFLGLQTATAPSIIKISEISSIQPWDFYNYHNENKQQ